MGNNDDLLLRRFHDLAGMAYAQNRCAYTGFLNEAEQSLLLSSADEFAYCPFLLFGGTEGCERQMAAFGTADMEEAAFPIACVRIAPKQQKFADALTHRDFLGAVMHLGLERECIGDICIKENVAFMFCTEAMANYIARNIDSVRHTVVRCEVTEDVPAEMLFTLKEQLVQAASPRIDAVIAKLFRLSREDANVLFRSKKVAVNAKVTENNSYQLKEGDTVSVRGYGKFIYDGVGSLSKKGKSNCMVRVYTR